MHDLLKVYSEEAAKKIVSSMKSISLKEVKGEGTFEVIATTEGVDRDGESILVNGWDFENYMKNPIILWGHNYWDISAIIGAATEIIPEPDKKRVIVRGTFANTEAGKYAKQLYEDGILKAVSVGFIPKERNGNIITKAELLELSFVSVPANADAVSTAKMSKFDEIIKTVVPPHEVPLSDINEAWDEVVAVQSLIEWATTDDENGEEVLDFTQYVEGFAWFDEEMKEAALPHHYVVEGELMCNFEGVKAAMTLLLSEESPVPEEEKQAVYDHLSEHYMQFGETAPEYQSNNAQNGDNAKDNEEDSQEEGKTMEKQESGRYALVKRGAVLSAKNKATVNSAIEYMSKAIDALKELVKASDGEEDTAKSVEKDEHVKTLQSLQRIVENAIKSGKKL